MSFNRQRYDECNEMDHLKTSKEMADYQLDPPMAHISQCIPNSPLVMMQRPVDGYMRGSVTDETDLRNINRPASKCPTMQYMPQGAGPELRYGSCNFAIDSTRDSNPVGNLRGIGYDRFDPISHNPQEHVFFPGQFMIDTRTVAKDNHRPCVPTPKINGMIPATANTPLPQVQVGDSSTFIVAPNLALYQKGRCG